MGSTQQAIILAQGTEITSGKLVDTNSAWLASQLWELGIEVRRILIAPDDLAELSSIIAASSKLAPLLLSTGGLGPTRDDLTAAAAAQATGTELVENAEALAQIKAIYARFDRPMAPSNRKQAVLPSTARVIANHHGTAPGFSVELNGAYCAFMPGVPHEMKRMFETTVKPEILSRWALSPPHLHTLRVCGIAESVLEERLTGIEQDGLSVGFRAGRTDIEVKLLFDASIDEEARAVVVEQARDRIGPKVFGIDTGDLAAVIGTLLTDRKMTLALAESCTGGKVAAWLTGVPGASGYFLESAVVYSNDAKMRRCGVPESMLLEYGAVSEPVCRSLAEGIRDRAGATFGIGITGIAGPTGGSPEKPVGTVHIAIAGPSATSHRRLRMRGHRDLVTTRSAAAALMLLFRELTGEAAT